VQLPDVVDDAWKGVNKAKYVWNKDPFLSKMERLGMKVENVAATSVARESVRLRRPLGNPFARKFLLDHEAIFKNCVNGTMNALDKVTQGNECVEDMWLEYKKYALDVVSNTSD
jgi:hypothetical protein